MTEFFMLTLVATLALISPGPDFTIVVKNSLSFGRLAGVYAAWGVALGTFCHISINLLGIGIIIAESVIAFTIMKILGAVYLIYLGYKGIRAKQILPQQKIKESTVTLRRGRKGFSSGFLACILNPKASLFYLSFFSVLLSPKTPVLTQLFYGVWLTMLALLWFILVAYFFTNPRIERKIASGRHWLERVTGGVLILFGLKLLSSDASK